MLCLLLSSVFAQTTETAKLLKQAEQMVFYNPAEAANIADHTLKNTTDNAEKARSLYISALSFYVSGKYDLALINVFESINLAEKSKNEEYLLKSRNLINRIFNLLNLKTDKSAGLQQTANSDLNFQAEDWVTKGENALKSEQTDSTKLSVTNAKKYLNHSNQGYQEALYYRLLGDIDFKNKVFISSLNNYKKSAEIIKLIDNPFLNESVYDRLAANYLALDSLRAFQESSKKSKMNETLSSEIEIRASNEAHKLKIAELDQQYKTATNPFINLSLILALFTIILAGVKIIFYIRNKNKLKMFDRFMNYLKVQKEQKESREWMKTESTEFEENAEKSIETEEISEVSHTRPGTLLKESEEHILLGLEKFEASNRYTHKDMSISKLASQLNTNTKYLSEVINRNKEKNFSAYINQLRINYITEKIKNNPAYLNYKVSYLAEECGYSSHSTFTTVFKSVVGVSPITFVEFIKEEIGKNEVSV